MFFNKKKHDFLPKEAMTKEGKKTLKLAESLESKGQIEEAADYYLQIMMISEAKELYKSAKAFDKLADIFIQENDFFSAASYKEKSGKFTEAANLYEQAEKFKEAAIIYKKIGVPEKAALLFEKTGEFEEAGNLYFALNKFDEAITMFEKINKTELLAQSIYEYIKNSIRNGYVDENEFIKLEKLAVKGAEIFEKSNRHQEAIKLFMLSKQYDRAAAIYEITGDLKKAKELYLKVGNKAKASEIFAKLDNIKESEQLKGEMFLEKGQILEAVNSFIKAEDFNKAAELMITLKKPLKAAELYSKAKQFPKAAKIYEDNNDLNNAAIMYEYAKNYKKAAELYKISGDFEKYSKLLESQQEFFLIGKNYIERGLYDKAIKAFQQVNPDDPNYMQASFNLAKIFEEKGIFNLAAEKYLEIIDGKKTSKNFAEVYYNLGNIYEKDKEYQKALEMYEKLRSVIFHYKDIGIKIKKVEEKIKEGTREEITRKNIDIDPYANTIVMEKKERYQIIEEIGKGGMGVVYKAEDTLLKRTVALKYLPKPFLNDKQAVERFKQEAQSAAQLNHENIVTIYDIGQEKNRFYIAMEYIEGKTLKQLLIKDGVFPINAIILILGQICRGVGFAHEKGFIHRDIKSSNIMWTPEKKIKIMDFGLATAMENIKDGETTTIVGTPYYMSPEQALGTKLDQRTDIYSIGITLYELLTGKPPFYEGDIGYHHIHTIPDSPKKFNSSIPTILEMIIMRSIEKDINKRFNSVNEILEELKNLAL